MHEFNDLKISLGKNYSILCEGELFIIFQASTYSIELPSKKKLLLMLFKFQETNFSSLTRMLTTYFLEMSKDLIIDSNASQNVCLHSRLEYVT